MRILYIKVNHSKGVIMFVIYDKEKQRVPIKVWLKNRSDLEADCLDQAMNAANHPCVFSHVALMPDTHFGYSVPIGSVIATKNVILPAMIGKDIACGMSYIKTNVNANILSKELLRKMIEVICRKIPVGFSHHKEPQDWEGWNRAPIHIPIIDEQLNKATYQIASMGSNNHFIEIQEVQTGVHKGKLSFMLHSGSRNFGLQIADAYDKIAKDLNEKWKSNIDPKWGLNFLPVDSNEGQEYIEAMKFAMEFAHQSRYLMMERIKNVVFNLIEKHIGKVSCAILNEVNIHHNYANLENHFGENVWVHRKGAIRMTKDTPGIIPGSKGTASYIVSGLQNNDSFHSASHGAGRRMGRMAATRELTLDEANKSMEGIVCNRWNKLTRGKLKGKHDLGEAPAAYKNIDTVIENESDLISVVEKVKQLAVIKA